MTVVAPRRPLVRRAMAGRTTLERGGAHLLTGPRVAVVAHWSPVATVTRSVATLVGDLQANGYRVAVASTCTAPGPLRWPGGGNVDLDALTVLRRPNVGHDFGSWSVALGAFPAVARAGRVLLANDSMAGPFASLGPLLEGFEHTAADVWGLTDTAQLGPHLQSYLLGFRDGVLAEPALARFWARTRCEASKAAVIERYEVGLSRLLRAEGYLTAPQVPHELVVAAGRNPVIAGWRRLVELGVPLVKRELLRHPSLVPDAGSIPSVLAEVYGVDVWAWVDEEPW